MSKIKDPNMIYDYDLPTVRQKARCGRRNWLWWHDKASNNRAAVATRETIKQCLLECGTEGLTPKKYREYRWFFIHAGCATSAIGYWAWGCMMLRNIKYWGNLSAR